MTRLVVDASVAIQLYFTEDYSDIVEQCFEQTGELLAPDLIWTEMTGVVWKRHRRADISRDEAVNICKHFMALPLHIYSSADLIPHALDIAMKTERTVYECLYVALAVMSKSVMVSADKRLVNALAGSPLEKYVTWIGEYR